MDPNPKFKTATIVFHECVPPPQSIPGLFQQHELPIQASGLHLRGSRWSYTSHTGPLPCFPTARPQSSSPCPAQTRTSKTSPRLMYYLFVVSFRQLRGSTIPQKATRVVNTELYVLYIVAKDRAWAGSGDGWHECEEPGGEV